MLQLSHTSCKQTPDVVARVISVAEHYGFVYANDALKKKPTAPLGTPTPPPGTLHDKALAQHTRQFLERRIATEQSPLSLYNVHINKQTGTSVGLHTLGIKTTAAEATLVSTLRTLLSTLNAPSPQLRIGSIGDKDSSQRYQRELTSFLRGHAEDMPQQLRDDITEGNVIKALQTLQSKFPLIAQQAPSPVDYLNEESRAHLHDVLEYLEVLGIPYELDPHIVANAQFWSHTLFEIDVRTDTERITVARGGRVALGKNLRIDMPQVSAYVDIEHKGRALFKKNAPQTPKFYFAHLGPLAKRLSFGVTHSLHEAGIPIYQSVPTESMIPQMKDAEHKKVPYVIIMGHKEALENTIIVRNAQTRVQHVVLQRELPAYLRRLKV